MAGGVHVDDARVHHLCAGAQQTVDDTAHVHLVSGDRMAGQNHGVLLADLHPFVVATGEKSKRRHRFALGSGGDDAHLLGRIVPDLLDVDDRRIGQLDETEVAGHAHVVLHGASHGGHDATVGDCGFGDLLHAVDVTGKGRSDDPPVAVFGEQRPQDRTHFRLARGVALLLGVGAVGKKQTNATVVGEGAEPRQVRAATVDRSEVDLEVSRVQHHALRRVQRDRVGVRDRVGDRNELDVERSDATDLAVVHHDEVGLAEQSRLFDAVARETERDCRAEDGERQFAQQELQSTDVVLVAVGGDAPDDPIGVLAQPREIREHEIDAVHVGVGEHEAAVDEHHLVVLLDGHAVAADLAEAAEKVDADVRVAHVERSASRFFFTVAARSATHSGAGPIGRRASPTANPRSFIISLVGSGFGASSPVSKA